MTKTDDHYEAAASDWRSNLLLEALKHLPSSSSSPANSRNSSSSSTGRFCVVGESQSLASPGLCIEGIPEALASPITCEQALHLIDEDAVLAQEKAPRQWHVEPDQISFSSPNWTKSVDEIAQVAREEMGVNETASPVSAELTSMVVYAKGARCLPFRISRREQSPGMFGVLMIVLPSAHEGGELIVSHAGHKVTFGSGGGLQSCRPKWIAFHAQCQLELLEVTKGCRIVLVYNLIHECWGSPLPLPPSPRPLGQSTSPPDNPDEAPRPPANSKLVYILENTYARDGLSWDDLKGRDADIAVDLQRSGLYDVYLVWTNGEPPARQFHRASHWIPAPNSAQWLALPDDLLCAFVRLYASEYLLDDRESNISNYSCDDDGASPADGGRAAIVLWPVQNRIAVLGMNVVTHVLCKAIRHLESPSSLPLDYSSGLCGYPDLVSLAKACFALDHQRSDRKNYDPCHLIHALQRNAAPPQILMDFLSEVLDLSGPSIDTRQISSLIIHAFRRHGCDMLQDALISLMTASERLTSQTKMETADCRAWRLIDHLIKDTLRSSSDNSKLPQGTPSLQTDRAFAVYALMAEALMPSLTRTSATTLRYRSVDAASVNPRNSKQIQVVHNMSESRSIVLHSLRVLHYLLGCDNLLDRALNSIIRNPVRFSPLRVLPYALEFLAEDVPGEKSFMKTLASEVIAAIAALEGDNAREEPPLEACEVRSLLEVLLTSSHSVVSGLQVISASPNLFPPFSSLVPAIDYLTISTKYRASMIQERAWPRALVNAFSSIDDDHRRPCQVTMDQIWMAIVRTYASLREYDFASTVGRGEPAIAMCWEGSWTLQFVHLLLQSVNTINFRIAALKELYSMLGPVNESPFVLLLSSTIMELRQHTRRPNPLCSIAVVATTKDWKIEMDDVLNSALHKHPSCKPCAAVREFFADNSRESSEVWVS